MKEYKLGDEVVVSNHKDMAFKDGIRTIFLYRHGDRVVCVDAIDIALFKKGHGYGVLFWKYILEPEPKKYTLNEDQMEALRLIIGKTSLNSIVRDFGISNKQSILIGKLYNELTEALK